MHLSIQHDQPVHVYDIDMGAAAKPLEESISGNEPVTNTPVVNSSGNVKLPADEVNG